MATTYEKIASVTVGSGGAASIDFTSIPGTFDDLLLKLSARTSPAARDDFLKIQFNNSSSNFTNRILFGTGSGTGSQSRTDGYASPVTASNATANTFNNAEIYIPNYTSNNAKSYSADGVQEDNDPQGFQVLVAGLWNPSPQAAITSIKLVPNTGNFVQYSTAVLYGIKKS